MPLHPEPTGNSRSLGLRLIAEHRNISLPAQFGLVHGSHGSKWPLPRHALHPPEKIRNSTDVLATIFSYAVYKAVHFNTLEAARWTETGLMTSRDRYE